MTKRDPGLEAATALTKLSAVDLAQVDAKLKAAVMLQVRLSSALLTVVTQLEMGIELYPALTWASKHHRVDQVDLSVAWMELVLRNHQTVVSKPWRDR